MRRKEVQERQEIKQISQQSLSVCISACNLGPIRFSIFAFYLTDIGLCFRMLSKSLLYRTMQ